MPAIPRRSILSNSFEYLAPEKSPSDSLEGNLSGTTRPSSPSMDNSEWVLLSKDRFC